MPQKHIGQIGEIFSRFEQIDFNSNQSLLDFDIIFFDINIVSLLLSLKNTFTDQSYIVDIRKKRILEKRKDEIREFFDSKRILILFLPSPEEYKFVEGNYVSGTSFMNTTLSPEFLYLEAKEGNKLDIVANTKFTFLLKKYLEIFYYRSCFPATLHVGTAIANIKNTNKAVACFNKNLIIFPSINESVEQNLVDQFGDELIALLNEKKDIIELPKWVNKYILPNELELLEVIHSLNEERIKLAQQIDSKENELNNLKSFKTLIFGSGIELENIVTDLLQNLGFKILNIDNYRDDLIVQYKERIAVIEIKGVTKSASEEHATQLEKWVTEYYLDKKVLPKGILIVNSFREVELNKRNGITFPNQMLQFSEKREHCLITTVQLLGLYYESLKNPLQKETQIETLFEAIGEYPHYKEWNKFIDIQTNTLTTSE